MKVISLFSGAGGFDLGFAQAGHKIIWANDNWNEAVETYRMNIGSHIHCKNIERLRSSDIPSADILIGGFPCQGFSVANVGRNTRDERNGLYRQFVRVLKAKRPRYFVAENVKGILSLGNGAIFQMIITDFARAGYSVQSAVLNAADYGVPQRRERVIILGTRNRVRPVLGFPPPPTHAPRDLAQMGKTYRVYQTRVRTPCCNLAAMC